MSNLTRVEETRKEYQKALAEESLKALQNTGIEDFRHAVSNTHDIYDLGRLAGNFASKVQKVRSNLGLVTSHKTKKVKNK